MRPLSLMLAPLFAALWVWCLATANPLGGFLHVPLVAAIICASPGRFRGRRAAAPSWRETGNGRTTQTHLSTT